MSTPDTTSASELGFGFRLGRYELLCLIAAGGMASVWAARSRDGHGAERIVAVKTILSKFAADARFQEMFLREGGIATHITHRNVVRVFELGEAAGVFFIAMEYIDGDALSRLERTCRRSGMRVAPGVALRVLADACAGLHEAHELCDGRGRPLHVVHRDVSSTNVLISTRGVAKVIDFGIAKTQLREGGDSADDFVKGKARYMSPEQALGSVIDRRADIWSAGAILLDLLADDAAHHATRDLAEAQRISAIRSHQPLPDTIHPAVVAIVRTALAHRPQDRFQTAAQMRDAIEDAMEKADLRTTQHDVAAFAARHLTQRTEARRAAIELALLDAKGRANVDAAAPGDGSASPRVRPSPNTKRADDRPFASKARVRRIGRHVAWTLFIIGVALGAGAGHVFFTGNTGRHPPTARREPSHPIGCD